MSYLALQPTGFLTEGGSGNHYINPMLSRDCQKLISPCRAAVSLSRDLLTFAKPAGCSCTSAVTGVPLCGAVPNQDTEWPSLGIPQGHCPQTGPGGYSFSKYHATIHQCLRELCYIFQMVTTGCHLLLSSPRHRRPGQAHGAKRCVSIIY